MQLEECRSRPFVGELPIELKHAKRSNPQNFSIELKYVTRCIPPRYPPQRGGFGGEKSLPSGGSSTTPQRREGFREGRKKSQRDSGRK